MGGKEEDQNGWAWELYDVHTFTHANVSINNARMEWLIGDIVLRSPVTPSVTNSRATSSRSLVATTSRVRIRNSVFLSWKYKKRPKGN